MRHRRGGDGSRRLVPCSSEIEHDASKEECAPWCSSGNAQAHCPWCKCKACNFCVGGSGEAPALAPSPSRPVATPRPPRGCPVGPSRGPLRLSACGAELIPSGGRLADGGPGKPLMLSGVNMFIQYYMELPSARRDIRWLRESVPSANVIRLVGVLWHDSTGPGDGLECSTDDPTSGYMSTKCVRALDRLIGEATAAGLWVILTARAKYAAGWGWPGEPDVWHSPALVEKYFAMWGWIAERYSTWERIAGYEIMSEPRTKDAAPERVASFMRGACDAVHRSDPRALCVVGPAPYYKAWNFDERVLLDRDNVLYTYDFFVPWHLVTADTGTGSDARFPGTFSCRDVYETWWSDFCDSSEQPVRVDASWLQRTTREVPYSLSRTFNVPVFCNQWGVKNELYRSHGRLEYARVLLDALVQYNVSSTYWIWRSYPKDDRPLDQPVWGFELVHNSGPREQPAEWVRQNLDTLESLDAEMTAVLQAGFPKVDKIPTEPQPPPPLPPVAPPFAPPKDPPGPPCSGLDFLRTRRTHLSGFAGGGWCSSLARGTEYDPDAQYACEAAWVDPVTPDPPADYGFDCSLGCSPCHYLENAAGAWVCRATGGSIFPCPPPTLPAFPPLLESTPPTPPRLPPALARGSSDSNVRSLWGGSLPLAVIGLSVSCVSVLLVGAAVAAARLRWHRLGSSGAGPRGAETELGAQDSAPSQPQVLDAGPSQDVGPRGRGARTKQARGDRRTYARHLDDEAAPLERNASSDRHKASSDRQKASSDRRKASPSAGPAAGAARGAHSARRASRAPLPSVDRAGAAGESGLPEERHRSVYEGVGAYEGVPRHEARERRAQWDAATCVQAAAVVVVAPPTGMD